MEPTIFRDFLAIAILAQWVTEATAPEDMADLTATAYALADAALSERTHLGRT
jgi:hypothetical protein